MAYLIITSIAYSEFRISPQFIKNYTGYLLDSVSNFKIFLIIYKSINDMTAGYLCEFVSIRKYSPKLKSSSQILLQVTVSRLKSYGDCGFSVSVATLWKKL